MLSPDRLKELYNLYYKNIYCFCLVNADDPSSAIDIAQETFSLLLEKSEELDDENIKSWLYEVACRKIKKDRNGKNIEYCDTDFLETLESDFSADNELEKLNFPAERIEELKAELIASLAANEQKLYSDVYEKKRAYAEISEELGISYKTLTVRISRLKKKLEAMAKIATNYLFIVIISFLLSA